MTDPHTLTTMTIGTTQPYTNLVDAYVATDNDPNRTSALGPRANALAAELVELIGLVVAVESRAPHSIAVQRSLCLATGIPEDMVEALVENGVPVVVDRDHALAIGLTKWLIAHDEIAPHLHRPGIEHLGEAAMKELVSTVRHRRRLANSCGHTNGQHKH